MVKIASKKVGLFLIGSFLGIIVLTGIVIYWYISTFLISSGLSVKQMRTIVQEAQTETVPNPVTFLILGLDQRQDNIESTLLTDSIIIAQLNTENGKLTMIPIPRDLWINELKTKINALYFYGEKRENTNGLTFATTEIEKIIGKPIDYTLIMNYNKLDELVDLIGGIEINVPQSFTDFEYPNSDYLVDQKQPIYTTIEFDKGLQNMNGKQALEYVRSRHSEGEEGSDLSRSKRQVHVFNGIIRRLSTRSFLFNPKQIGLLYRFWDDQIVKNLTDSQVLALGLSVNPKTISIESIAIPTGSSYETNVILINPPVSKYGLWVWEPVDSSWGELKTFIKSSF